MLSLSLCKSICEGATAQSLTLTVNQAILLTRYVELLCKWNKAYNLTAIRDPIKMVSRHILDSLSIISFIEGNQLLDVGSGSGLPGIPLAIMSPEKQFTLLDSNSKKTRFMIQVKIELNLKNIHITKTRIESFQANMTFDVIMSRAFSSLINTFNRTKHLLSPIGKFLAMKGLYPKQELNIFKQEYPEVIPKSHALSIPGYKVKRHVVIVKASV